MKRIPISHNGIISKTTLLVIAGILLISGTNDIELHNLFFEGTLKILLSVLLIFTRDFARQFLTVKLIVVNQRKYGNEEDGLDGVRRFNNI